MRRIPIGLVILMLGLSPHAGADMALRISYQGTLADSAGLASPDGLYSLQFSIVDDATPLPGVYFSQTLEIDVKGGVFNALLESQPAFSLADAFDDEPRFMAVTVLSGPTGAHLGTVPLQEITSVPFAFSALKSADVSSPPPPPDPLPVGSIVLWDLSDACPNGYSEVSVLRGRFPAGVDVLDASDHVGEQPGDQGGSVSGRHSHSGTAGSASADILGPGSSGGRAADPSHGHTLADNDRETLPPFYSVLFCEKTP